MTSLNTSSQLFTTYSSNCIYCPTNSYEQRSLSHLPLSPINVSPSYYQYPFFHNNTSPEFHQSHYYSSTPDLSLYPPSPPYYELQQTGLNQKYQNKTQIRNIYGPFDFNVGDGAGSRMIGMTNRWMGYNGESEYNAKF